VSSPDGYQELLAVLWSGNDNELCQLQVLICSVIHHCSFVHNKDMGEKCRYNQGFSKMTHYETKCYILLQNDTPKTDRRHIFMIVFQAEKRFA